MQFLGLAGAVWGCAGTPPYLKSDHFDGARFHNLKPIPSPSVWRVARHVLFGRNGAWPEEKLAVNANLRLSNELEPHEVAVTFVNHATVLIQLPGLTVLTDPVWSERVGPWSWAGPARAREPGIPFELLPAVDVVMISHNHFDHLDLPTLKRLAERDQPRVFVPLGDQAWLSDAGVPNVEELDWWQAVELDDETSLVFTPAQHNSGRSPWSNNRSLWGSFVLKRRDTMIYFAGDTAYESHFKEVRRRFGPADLAFLPIGAYAPRDMMKYFHMNPAEAVRAQRDLEARIAVGIHFGTFQLTGEDFDDPVAELRRALAASPEPPGPFLALAEGRTQVFALGRKAAAGEPSPRPDWAAAR